MKAAVLHGVDQPLLIEDIDIDEPRAGEVLVKTSATGVCHSDLHFIEGLYPSRFPVVLGHESAGVVEKIGEGVTNVVPGDRVVVAFVASCALCDNCVQGKIHDIAYLGNLSTYHVELPNGTIIKAQTANTRRIARRSFTWEDQVWLSWTATAGVMLAR